MRMASPWPTSMTTTVGTEGHGWPPTGITSATTQMRERPRGRVRGTTMATASADTARNANNPSCGPPAPRSAMASTSAAPDRATVVRAGWGATTAMSPTAVVSDTTGAATMLVIGATSGIDPKTASSRGATATCAPIVAPSGIHSQPGVRPLTTRTPTSTPAVAQTDSRNPTEVARSADTRRDAAVATPSAIHASAGTPTSPPSSGTSAIADARTTEGSHRVATTNTASPTTPLTARRRGWMATGIVTIHHAPRNNATFDPDTATKCASPARRRSSSFPAGRCDVSPMRRPSRSASAGSPPPKAARTRERSALPTTNTGDRSTRSVCSRSTSRVPATSMRPSLRRPARGVASTTTVSPAFAPSRPGPTATDGPSQGIPSRPRISPTASPPRRVEGSSRSRTS